LPEPAGLAFKAYEIEELADVYFFRPVGLVFARAAHAARLTPTAVTILGTAVGVVGGALLYDQRLGLLAFALIIFYGVLDSSDGQLARITGRSSEFGRMLDGIGGYVVHVAIYLSIIAGTMARGGGESILIFACAAAVSNIIHAQMYDYHRGSYIRCAIEGKPNPSGSHDSPRRGSLIIVAIYEAMERWLAGSHPEVELALRARATDPNLRAGDRDRYRRSFYWPVRGWNLMGDNTRFYALGVLAWLQRLDWFFIFLLAPMNIALLWLWVWQRRADRRFLAGL
jgi:phosphatidylglycerophosphate synthase